MTSKCVSGQIVANELAGQTRSQSCVFCGQKATTRDHIPPKGLFQKPRPSSLLTVPSCRKCNNSASKFDEQFRNFIVMASGRAEEALSLWNATVVRGIRRNRREFARLVGSMARTEIYTQRGLYVRTAVRCTFEAEPHDETIRRITRGLYWHHNGFALDPTLPIDVHIVDLTSDESLNCLRKLLPLMRTNAIGRRSVFEYAYVSCTSDPSVSAWVYKFFDAHIVSAFTGHLGSTRHLTKASGT